MSYKALLSSLALVATVGCSEGPSQQPISPKKHIDTTSTYITIEEKKSRIIGEINVILEEEGISLEGHSICRIGLQGDKEKQVIEASLICDDENIISKRRSNNNADDYIAGVERVQIVNGKLVNYSSSCLRILRLYKEHGKVIRIEDDESKGCEKNNTI